MEAPTTGNDGTKGFAFVADTDRTDKPRRPFATILEILETSILVHSHRTSGARMDVTRPFTGITKYAMTRTK